MGGLFFLSLFGRCTVIKKMGAFLVGPQAMGAIAGAGRSVRTEALNTALLINERQMSRGRFKEDV